MKRIMTLASIAMLMSIVAVPATSVAAHRCSHGVLGVLQPFGYVEAGTADRYHFEMDEGDILTWEWIPYMGYLDFAIQECTGETVVEDAICCAYAAEDPVPHRIVIQNTGDFAAYYGLNAEVVPSGG